MHSLPVALTHLKGYRDNPINGTQAVAYLRQFDGDHPIYRLYRIYFPFQWASSTASLHSTRDGGYSPREAEFLRLVERSLFPLDSDYLLDLSDEGRMFNRIELLPYAPRWWDEEGEFAPGWLMLILVSGVLFADEALRRLNEIEGLAPALRRSLAKEILAEPGYSLVRLRELCSPLFGPLVHLPVALSMMLYATGNEWLDIPGDDGTLPFDQIELRWCEQHMEMLCATFREAQYLESQAQSLVDWLEADFEAHLASLLALLQQAQS